MFLIRRNEINHGGRVSSDCYEVVTAGAEPGDRRRLVFIKILKIVDL